MKRTLPFVLLLAATTFACSSVFAAPKPKIILILADDLGYETLGCDGGESYKTPNLDGLAATGMRFERCYVQPLCSPTRVQVMTGIYNVRNYSDWANIDPSSTTFATLLKKAGYATAIAGKWQLGRDKDLPQRLGFDEACLWQHTRRPPRYANPGLEFNGEPRDFTHGEYGPDLINAFALEFIEKHKDGPFLLYYPMLLTHKPFQPTPDSPDWDPKLTGVKAGDDVKHFPEMVAYMDKLTGKVVKKLDDLHIRDNTLIIFFGDNGTPHGVTSLIDGNKYEGGKGLSTDRGMHVPLIANWPGHTLAGRVNDDLIDSTDFVPTLCEAAGVEVPSALNIDGHSFMPQILGKKGSPREWIYSWFSMHGGPRGREFAMDKNHKLYRNGDFVNLSANAYEEHPQKADELKGEDAQAAKKLTAVLAKYKNARTAEVSAVGDIANRKARNKAARQGRRAARTDTDD